MAGLSLRVRTRLTYSTHHRNYLRYCAAIGHDPLVALDEYGLCALMIHYIKTHKITTLPSFMSGVSNWYAQHALGPLPRNKLYADVKTGLENFFGLTESSDPRTAFTFEDVCMLVTSIDVSTFNGARDALLYLLSYYGLLRRSETGARLTLAHVMRHDWGLALTIPYSKTNLRPVTIRISARASGDSALCPLAAFDRYLAMIPPRLRHPTLPLFRECSDRSSPHDTDKANSLLLQRVVEYLQKDASTYGWHSFRRGGTTLMFLAGVPESLIAAHGRWSSLTYRRYFDNSVHQLLPTQRVMRFTQSKRSRQHYQSTATLPTNPTHTRPTSTQYHTSTRHTT